MPGVTCVAGPRTSRREAAMVTITPLDAVLGAEIRGVDLSAGVDDTLMRTQSPRARSERQMSEPSLEGGCLCGTVRYRLAEPPTATVPARAITISSPSHASFSNRESCDFTSSMLTFIRIPQ